MSHTKTSPATNGNVNDNHNHNHNGASSTRGPSLAAAGLSEPPRDKVTWTAILKAYAKTANRKYYRTRNSIRNGTWPTSAGNLYACCLLVYGLMALEPTPLRPLTSRLWSYVAWLETTPLSPPKLARMLTAVPVACAASFVLMSVVMLVRQLILRCLLSYRGWMYASMRSPPLRVKLWAVLVRLFSGYRPSLYSFQRCLPRMSVPAVEQTMSQLRDSMRCLLSDAEFAKFCSDSRQFETKLAPTLQWVLYIKSWLTQNYVSDWWEKYVYLRSRTPLANNCNYYIMDQSYWRATSRPVARAASLVANILRFKQLVEREELPPLVLRDTIPICMAQYERLFSTTRVPKPEIDELVHYDTTESRHIVVIVNGVYYKLDCYDCDNNLLCAKKIEEHIECIVRESCNVAKTLSYEQRTISSLTALERSKWAQIRHSKLNASKANSRTLHDVESAMFCLWIFNDDKPQELSERAKLAFQGNADYRLWFDKCFNVVVFGDGHCAINCEHSLCDAPAYAHMWEFTLCKDVLECTFDSDGCCFPPLQTHKQALSKRPEQLVWRLDDNLAKTIQEANDIALRANADVDLQIFDHSQWGKGAIKRCKVSPDAFVQLAIQLAYFKQTQTFVQTYEASMTRLYLNGRTETVRSCTAESCAFVKAMLEPSASRQLKVELLQRANEKHTRLYKDAMNGKGIDRHLFGLFVASKALGYECDFLADLLAKPWTLSTSQTPHTQQTAVPDPNYQNFADKLCSGGGFMAVADDGYGVSYLFPSDQRIFFHMSSRRSSSATDTTKFGALLFESLDQILALFDEPAPSGSKID